MSVLNKLIDYFKFAYFNAGNLFITKIIGIGLNYLVLLLVLHHFGLYGNGELADFIAQSRGVMIVLIFGLDIVLVKRLNYKEKSTKQVLVTAIAFISNIIFYCLLILIINLIFNVDLVFLFGAVVLAIWRYISNFYRGKNNMILYGFFEFIVFQLSILVSILLSKSLEVSFIYSIVYVNSILVFIACIVTGIKYSSKIKGLNFSISFKNDLIATYKESFHFVLSTSIILISTAIIYKIIKANYSTELLGVYDTLLKFSQIIVLPLVATNGRVIVISSKYFFSKNMKAFQKYIVKITRMLAMASTVCALIAFVVLYIYVQKVNKEFDNYWLLFFFMALSQLINNWAGPAETVLQVTNNIKIFNKIIIIAVTYLIVSISISTQFYSIEVVAINTAIYMFIINFFSLRVIRKRLGINPYKLK